MEKQWEFDKFHEDSYELAKNAEIRKYKNFLETFSKNLYSLEENLHKFPHKQFDFDLDPINLESIPYEQGSLLQLIKTDNRVLNKIVTVFAALCSEIDFLVHEGENKYTHGLLLYGEGPEVSKESGHNLGQMARFVAFFQELLCFVNRCYEVVKSTLQQLNIVYSSQKAPYKIDTTEMHLRTIFIALGNLLRILLTIDLAIEYNPHLRDDWNAYKRMVKNVHHNPNKFDIDIKKFYRFEKHLIELEGKLLDGYIFQNCVERIYDEKNAMLSKNVVLSTEFFFNIKHIFDEIEPNINENSNIDTRHKFVSVCTLTVLYNQIYRNVDRKFFKYLWDTNKKIPVIILNGVLPWFSNDFLFNKLPNLAGLVDKNPAQTNMSTKQSFYQMKILNLSKINQQINNSVNTWLIKMQSLGDLNVRACLSYEQLLAQGIEYCNYLNYTVSLFLNLALSLNTAITKSNLLELCKLIELVKAIQKTYHEKRECLTIAKQYIIQSINRKILSFIQNAKKRLTSDKKYTEKRLDILSGLVLAGNALNGPSTKERILIGNFGLTIANRMKTFKADENVDELLKKLENIAYLELRIKQSSDFSYLFWHFKVLTPIYLTDIYENANIPNKVQYMVWALRDIIEKFGFSRHTSHELVCEKYLRDFLRILYKNFIERICRDIETDLRLSIHLDLKSDQSKLFKEGIKDLSKFVTLQPIVILDKFIDIKSEIIKYLSRTFYNLTAVALHDWKAYSEMRNLAQERYNLVLSDPHLPSSTLEQGLDVLEIMRNIHVFVTRYLYNLNNQIFVEKNSQNKSLNTINIRHVANSIRTHGIGIMNTTVNFTYQFLKKQFYIFSQFLFDEHIKAKLIKDISFFKESKVSLNQKYPYERAEKFNRAIRKLGILNGNETYMDRFRVLISHIGNAIGYVRMIRSGGLNFCSNSIRFVPDIDDIVSFEEYANELNTLSEPTKEAAKNLDSTLASMVKNFSEGTDYFKILLDVFKNEFRSEKNIHLKNFYIILPSLTLNFVEYIIGAKEKINKKNSNDAAFTDDGFAMGIAYILKLLDQNHDFDSLHWFESVRDKFTSNTESIVNQQKNQQSDDKLMQTQALTLQRYSTYQKEFNLLQFAFTSAQIFFRTEEIQEEKN